MTTIFLSYARGDDEPFARRLYEDLTRRGFDVWWDRVSMPNRALTFLHEIRDAIAARDRLILVVGPRAVQSDYLEAEWRYALEIGKAIKPVLRLGEYDLLPDELKLLDAPDFRNDADYPARLETLVRQVSEPVAPMGKLIGVPSLPPRQPWPGITRSAAPFPTALSGSRLANCRPWPRSSVSWRGDWATRAILSPSPKARPG